MKAYQIKRTDGKHVRQTVLVDDQFGRHIFQTKKEFLLLAPTAKDLAAPVAPPDAGYDDYKCYKVKELKKRCTGDLTTKCKVDEDCATAGGECHLGLEKGVTERLTDQFEAEVPVEVKKPKLLCLPAQKAPQDIINPVDHLTCYQIKRTDGQKHLRREGIHLNNEQFGSEVVSTIKAQFLCVRSLKIASCITGPLDPTAERCPPNSAGGPNLLALTLQAGSDLDVGWTGASHNHGVVIGAQAFACLDDCDTSSDPTCTGTIPFGAGTINGTTFGPPMPLLTADTIGTCIVSRWTSDIGVGPSVVRSANLQTGEIDMRVTLKWEVFLTGNKERPCPICSGAPTVGASGTCEGGPDNGKPCVTEGLSERFGPTSSDCQPIAADSVGILDLELDPLTSGQAASVGRFPCTGGFCPRADQARVNNCVQPATCDASQCPSDDVASGIQPGVDQTCCVGGGNTIGCFPADGETPSDPLIVRNGEAAVGQPPWPGLTYPKIARGGKVASVFLIDATQAQTINTSTGLPGPGALEFVADVCVDFSQ
jgi:hypothetical protein